ncbi:lytic transglycosylase domain-containing protein [Nitriliruptor alkaliphilus]|uniref:lytic transglycosylase domain-containing protein n=1 Tax=Nitriliruptor alkaliphilus TaxID=427918 RepID=UPI0006984581|nr:transglycosylase SLT domain-containing protein [Nitriliruptor alkaliphilus]
MPHQPLRRVRRSALPAAVILGLVAAGSADYVVARGDTLTGIARAHGTTVSAIVAANDLPDADRIRAGDRLTLPDPAATARADVGAVLDRVARERGWSPAFVKAVAWQESGWNPRAVSSAGAIGVMQVMPETGRFVSRELVGRDLDLEDVHDNVTAGVAFLQHLWELTDGDPELTLAGYYQGLRSVAHNGMYDDTERYVANVLALRERFR